MAFTSLARMTRTFNTLGGFCSCASVQDWMIASSSISYTSSGLCLHDTQSCTLRSSFSKTRSPKVMASACVEINE